MRLFITLKRALVIGLFAGLVPAAPAATVRFELVATGRSGTGPIVVAPGGTVAYEIRALVRSDDAGTPDNVGLAFFNVTIATDLGVTQPRATLDPAIVTAFPLLPSTGSPIGDDLVQVSAGQNTIGGQVVNGIAVGTAQVLATGQLVMPATEGQFTARIDSEVEEAQANLLPPGGGFPLVQGTIEYGDPLTIQVSASAPVDPPPPGPICAPAMPASMALSFVGLSLLRTRRRAPRV